MGPTININKRKSDNIRRAVRKEFPQLQKNSTSSHLMSLHRSLLPAGLCFFRQCPDRFHPISRITLGVPMLRRAGDTLAYLRRSNQVTCSGSELDSMAWVSHGFSKVAGSKNINETQGSGHLAASSVLGFPLTATLGVERNDQN